MVLIIYDIPDNKRRSKLAQFLEGYGRRVQKSAFEAFIPLAEMRRLQKKVLKRVKAKEDNVRFYWIPENSVKQTLTIGSLPPEEPPECIII